MSRAIRRHHYERMKTKRLRQIRRENMSDGEVRRYEGDSTESLVCFIHHDKKAAVERDKMRAVFLANTGTPCSCHMCGNPRMIEKGSRFERTIQERKSSLSFREQINGEENE